TIMGYAGITGNNDVQSHSDAYFNYHSIRQILTRLETRTCWTSTNITNNPPVANAGDDYTIPKGTAFVLKGAATTDADNSDVLTYAWEQIDNGVSNFNNFGPTKTTGATFRSRPPTTSSGRFMPTWSRILSGQLTETNPVKNTGNTSWETVSTVARTLSFALTVRDRSEANGVGQFPQSSYDLMTVTVDDATGPFVVTSQATAVVWTIGDNQDIAWDVAGTNSGAINVSTVTIKLSIDGGLTFPYTLASSVANDGSHTIVVPDIGTTVANARILIEPTNNIFLAVNSVNFTVQQSAASVDDEQFQGFKLYPNPSSGIVNLQFQVISNDHVSIKLYDLAGRTVSVKNYKNVSSLFNEEIEFANIASGLYLMKVLNGGKYSTHKIVIE
ncbi:MAG: T9SS type A sorting domain-containing protein, partial [Flavobacteriaceae bacterium]|nr:T9SS type A sorting domain-containing protein [Flavobacteriaceae bacterium]